MSIEAPFEHELSRDVLFQPWQAPRHQRMGAQALELHGIEGFKYREVAEIMEVPLGTVMSRIARGRRLFAALILDDRHVWDLDPMQAADANAHTRQDSKP